MFILGNWISTNSFKLGFLWFQSSLMSLKPGFEQVIVKSWNRLLTVFMVSMIWGLICPDMTLILFNLYWLKKLDIISLNEFRYCFSGGWIIKSSSLFLIKKVLKEVPFSRLNSSSNLSLLWSRNLMQVKFSAISNFEKFWFYSSKLILISDILKTYLLIVISNFSMMNCCLAW